MLYSLLYYVILSIIIIIISFNIYLKIAHPFWSIQPAFHIYDIHLWGFPNRIINQELPTINKYVKILDTETFKVKSAPTDILYKSCALIKNNYLRSKNVNYIPSNNDILGFLQTTTYPSFITIYSVPKTLYLKKGTMMERDILGVITARPMNLTFYSGKITSILVNYVDNMCVRKDSRKKGIGQILIQTLHHNIRHLNKDIKVCLFKREGEMTAIVPLTTYNTTGYNMNDIPNIKLDRESIKVIHINSQNFNLLSLFLKEFTNSFECVLNPEKSDVLQLIINDLLDIYILLEDNIVYAAYFFRNTNSYINNIKGVECIAAIDKTPHKDTFFRGFCHAIKFISKKTNSQFLWLEQTSDVYYISDFLNRYNVKIQSICQNAFFLYNYAKYSHKPEKCFLLY